MHNNSKRIARNTLLLYVRMLFLMLISLYTSRVILNALGESDYGIYNVVGGVVLMFSVLSGSLSAAISRFITYELGVGSVEKLKRVFSSSVTIQFGLAAIMVVLAETIGLWFVKNHMVIPAERMTAAIWVYQLSVVTFAVGLVSVPYNAAIIAHERMSAFAYISIIEAVGKLVVAWAISINPIDRLVFFAIMVALIAVVIRFIYGWYCKRYFEECTYHFVYDHTLLKQMFGFAGWNFIGASSAVLRDHGGNILINLFFGPTVNAARAIATRINIAITSFVSNFMVALNPQITKSYANGDHEYMFKLIFQGARFSFYILLLLCLPVILNTHFILVVWLKLVPEHTVEFVQLSLLFALCECVSSPLVTAMLATGRIRNYQIVVGGLQMMNLPVSWIFLYFGAAPESVVIVAIFISQCCLLARLIMLRGLIGLKARAFMKSVCLNVLLVFVLSSILPFLISRLMPEGLACFAVVTFSSLTFTAVAVLWIGCSAEERVFVFSKVRQIKQKLTNDRY